MNLSSLRQTIRDHWSALPPTGYCYSFQRRFNLPPKVETSLGEGLVICLCYCRPVQLQCTALAILDRCIWLLSYRPFEVKSGVYKCSLLCWHRNPVLSQKCETWFMCLGSHRTQRVFTPILKITHITLPGERISSWNTWQRKEMSVKMRLG